jgi:hypothetical protein
VKREFLTEKSCAPNCTISCVHQVSYIDHWRAPQTTGVHPLLVLATTCRKEMSGNFRNAATDWRNISWDGLMHT